MSDFIAGQFRTVPDWVLESDISDGALRLYMVMLKFADNGTGQAYPGRRLLSQRTGKSLKSVDRYIDELERVGAVTVEARWKEGRENERASNLYHLHHTQGVASSMSNVASRASPPSPHGRRPPLPTSDAVTRTNELEPFNSSSEAASAPPDLETRRDVEGLCQRLADLIEANGSKRPTITKSWKDAARLMLDRDNRPIEEIERVMCWSQQDEFWKANIMSMPKLRGQFDKLRLRAQSAQTPNRFRTVGEEEAWMGGAWS